MYKFVYNKIFPYMSVVHGHNGKSKNAIECHDFEMGLDIAFGKSKNMKCLIRKWIFLQNNNFCVKYERFKNKLNLIQDCNSIFLFTWKLQLAMVAIDFHQNLLTWKFHGPIYHFAVWESRNKIPCKKFLFAVRNWIQENVFIN